MTKSSKNLPQTREFEEAGHKIKLWLTTVGKRSETVVLAEPELEKLAEGQLINAEDMPVAEYQGKPPEPPPEEVVKEGDAPSEEYQQAVAEHAKAMEEYIVSKAELDSHDVKIFHTLRGPVMGMVVHEDMNRALVYSPCLIDPNVQAEKIHYFPIAFAGFNFTIYKGGMGESIPQEGEIRGYPHFLNRNRAGDYRFRMRSAYHHIDASMPDDAKITVAPAGVRDNLFGLVPTSNSEEQRQITRMRQAQAAQQKADGAPPETPPAEPAEAAPSEE